MIVAGLFMFVVLLRRCLVGPDLYSVHEIQIARVYMPAWADVRLHHCVVSYWRHCEQLKPWPECVDAIAGLDCCLPRDENIKCFHLKLNWACLHLFKTTAKSLKNLIKAQPLVCESVFHRPLIRLF